MTRMQESTLFTHDLAGECRAAQQAWGLAEGAPVNWRLGVVEAPEHRVRLALAGLARVYLLIVNTPDECVIGGETESVARLVTALGCRFFALQGVTTVHCAVAEQVAGPYHDLHLFPTEAPSDVVYYSGVKGGAYEVNRESAAASILGQALHGLNYPTVVETAYQDGVRLFLEMGPGGSCSRMIGRILGERPHLARSACPAGQDPISALLKLLASLIAERVPVDLAPMFDASPTAPMPLNTSSQVRVVLGGSSFQPPRPPAFPGKSPAAVQEPRLVAPEAADSSSPAPGVGSVGSVLQELARAQQSHAQAHAAFLTASETISRSMAQALALEISLRQALGDSVPELTVPAPPTPPTVAFDRQMCLEFARGSVGRMLGSRFAEVDGFPTRVRLPDEPLMLVDRIITVEGEPRSMTHGRVVTEHDIQPGAWYLDGGRIPTCIAVEAGQADLFLSGYLGIDFITRGLAVYRLLDAVVTFHRGLPGPGRDHPLRHPYRTVFPAGRHLAVPLFLRGHGQWSAAALHARRLRRLLSASMSWMPARASSARPSTCARRPALRPTDWQELVPMSRAEYGAAQLDRLRDGDLAGCFGPLFAGLPLTAPLTIPGGRMHLVHRVMEIDPAGGRCGIGIIRAEADIHPDDWFITCHFVDDRVMPGTLMYECCMHTLRIYLLRLGWVAESGDSVWEPVPGVASKLCCRGQVLETTKVVTYEVTIREIGYRPGAVCHLSTP